MRQDPTSPYMNQTHFLLATFNHSQVYYNFHCINFMARMRTSKCLSLLIIDLGLQGCLTTSTNPDDPYEPINRGIYKFNQTVDAIVLKPVAKLYATITPAPLRAIINNFYTNINMIPTLINDILQADVPHMSQDGRRLILNSTLGIGGFFDVATPYNSPFRSNDLGITFAKWGDKQSPYVVIPLLGPSTIRDGMALMFDYTFFTPYPFIPWVPLYSILGFRYVDLRAQMLDSERLIDESLDKYAFLRDAYLQHRRYLIQGENIEAEHALYVDEKSSQGKTPQPAAKPQFPLTTSSYMPSIVLKHAHRQST